MLTDKELEEIRRKLQAVEEEPPVMGWQNIQQELKPAKRRRPFLWLWPLLLLLPLGIGIWYNKTKNTNESVKTAVVAVPNKNPELVTNAAKPNLNIKAARKKALTQAVKPGEQAKNQSGMITHNSALNRQKNSNPSLAEPGINTAISTRKKARLKAVMRIKNDDKTSEKLQNINNEIPSNSLAQNTLTVPGNNFTIKIDSAVNTAGTIIPKYTSPENIKIAQPVKPDKTDSLKQRIPNVESTFEKQRKAESWTLGVLFAPRYAFRRVKANTYDEILVTDLKEENNLNAGRMGFEFGLTFSKPINQKLYMETGLSVMELKENVEYSFTTGKLNPTIENMNFAPDGSVMVSAGYLTEDRKLKSSYRYGGMRMGTTYYFRNKVQSRFNITAAAGANLLLKGRTAQYINGLWTETVYFPSRENILEQSNYNLLMGVGYSSHLFRNFEVMVMPTLNYFLGSTYLTREPIGLRPYSLGLTVQVKNIFNKKQ